MIRFFIVGLEVIAICLEVLKTKTPNQLGFKVYVYPVSLVDVVYFTFQHVATCNNLKHLVAQLSIKLSLGTVSKIQEIKLLFSEIDYKTNLSLMSSRKH